MISCENCGKVFTRSDNMRRHQKIVCTDKRRKVDHAEKLESIKCDVCDVNVVKKYLSAHLRSNNHKKNAFVVVDDGVERITGAFGNKIVSYKITYPGRHIDIIEFMHLIREKILTLVESLLVINANMKINLECFATYVLKETPEVKSFNTKNKIISVGTDIYKIYSEYVDEISCKMSEFQERDSGWSLLEIVHMEVNMHKFNPIKGGTFIELPKSISAKKAVINVQNNDECCFAWALTSAICQPSGLPQRISSYPHYSTVCDFSDVIFPMQVKEIPKFEIKNQLAINVYTLISQFTGEICKHEVVPVHVSTMRNCRQINLLLITNGEGNSHYCWIRNLSRLVSNQISKGGHEKYICNGCLVYFSNLENMERHQEEDCFRAKAVLPTDNVKVNKFGEKVPENILQFENFEKQMRLPFVVYADFEALLKPLISEVRNTDRTKPYTIKSHQHDPYAFAYYIKCNYDDSLSKLKVYAGIDAGTQFINRLEEDVKEIYKNHLSVVKPLLPLSELDKKLQSSNICHICEKQIKTDGEKVIDHDHLTGKYRGPAHSVCNVNYKIPKFIPVLFHNLTNYDCHMFVKQIALNEEDVDVIAKNKEKYISFSKKIRVGEMIDCKGKKRGVFLKLRFLDSFRFMSSSLAKLCSYLEDNQCREVKKFVPDETKFKAMRQKGVFPYMFMDSFDKLKFPRLPDKAEFYDSLTDESVSDEDYERAVTVWKMFDCKTMEDYALVYLKSDVLLLADIFESFRNVCIDYYKLDPTHYFTAPGFGWDALLKMTKVKLELLTDIDMLHFFRKGIRGGVSMCTKRKAVANNKFLADYKEADPTSYILYLDATNLYGFAMTCKLPTGNFRWLQEEEFETLNICSISDDSAVGYVFEVDLEYPAELHNHHNDLPFCSENLIPPGSKFPRLIPNLMKKEKYIIHYRNLKQCIKYGLKVIKIRRVLEFQQSNWMEPYINFNTVKRGESKNEFERNHYKAMNNVVFGKTMENVEKRVDIRLLTHWENRHQKQGVESYIAKPHFKSSKVFCENLVAIQMAVAKVNYNKPLYVGFAILEISKIVMYDFFYGFLKSLYNENVKLLYTDTDSLILQIFTTNVYQDIKDNIDKFDTSNFKTNNIHDMPINASVLGNMKDEYAGKVIKSFYGTGAKAYCINLEDTCTKKAKGVKKYVIDKHLTPVDYKMIVEDGGEVLKEMMIFRSDYHVIYTELKNKVALSGKDEKRFIMQDRCNTLAWGHYRIKYIQLEKEIDEIIGSEMSKLNNERCLYNDNKSNEIL